MKVPDLDIKKFRRRFKDLREDQQSYISHWVEVRDYMSPRSGKYLHTDTDEVSDRGTKRGNKIINGVAYDAGRTLAAGFHGGVTSPARPWFALALANKDVMNYAPVKRWLDRVRDIILLVMARSNFYNSMHSLYNEMALFGTTAMIIESDERSIIRCRPFTIGEFAISTDAEQRPNSLFRQFKMTAAQMQQKFGKDAIPFCVKQAIDNNRMDENFEVAHGVEPSSFRDPSRKDYKGMAYQSVYFLAGNNKTEISDDDFLRVSGYQSIPFIAPRWSVVGVNTYGDGPGMFALGDCKQLQSMEEKKLKALAKEVDPPMNAPASMENVGGTVVAGGINFVDVTAGGQTFAPAYQVSMNLQNLVLDMTRVETRIKRYFFNDLFLSLINETKRMTAAEVAQRYEEKLIMLGPVLERVQDEALDIIIERVFNIVNEFGGFPTPPKELMGQEISPEYTSILAQAQKMVGTQGIEQFAGFVSMVAQLDPTALNRVNFDKAIDIYGDKLGIPEEIIRSDEETQQLKDQQQKQQQLMQMATVAKPMADAAKAASETQVNGQSALETMTQQSS